MTTTWYQIGPPEAPRRHRSSVSRSRITTDCGDSIAASREPPSIADPDDPLWSALTLIAVVTLMALAHLLLGRKR